MYDVLILEPFLSIINESIVMDSQGGQDPDAE